MINYSIPLKWNKQFIDKILSIESKDSSIESFYGCIENLGYRSGRIYLKNQDISIAEALKTIKYLKSKGKVFYYLLNAPVVNTIENIYQVKEMIKIIINELKPDALVITSPQIMDIVRMINSEIRIHVSTIAGIKTVEQAKQFMQYEPARIVPHHDTPKYSNLLIKLKRYCDSLNIELELMVTESCIMSCKERESHYKSLAEGKSDRKFHNFCRAERLKNPSLLLSAGSFIPPEEVKHFKTHYDINKFKITGRSKSVNFLINAATSYLHNKSPDNIVSIMGIDPLVKAEKWIYIKFSSLLGMHQELYDNQNSSNELIYEKYYKKAMKHRWIQILEIPEDVKKRLST